MLPRSPHLQFVPPRVEKARGRLEAMIWRVDDTPLPVAQSKSSREETFVGDAAGLAFLPVEQTPHVWGQRFDQCWWKVQIPGAESEASPARARYLCWRDQGEATAYFEGQAVAGIDPGHTMLALPEALWSAAGELLIESICCRTGIWVPGAGQGISDAGSVFEGAFLATRDDDAWAAYFDVEVLLDLAVALHRKDHPLDGDWPSAFGYRPPLEHASPVCRRIIDGLDRAVDALDHDGPAALREVTQKLLADLPADATAMDATLTGHAHIDLVWLWPERTGEFKAVHSLANVLDVQRRYPEMVFGYTQPASFEAVERRAPELFERVLGAAQQKRFEPTGAMYVESDTQLPCGEALVRAFELGQANFRRYRPDGSDCSVVWLPDVFGYSAALPTIMAGFGVPYFYTTKMHWSSATKIPFSSFRWAGMDGSEVVAHLSWNFYNLAATVDEVRWPVDQHRQAAVHHETLIPIGYGDGGGGPNDAMCERARRIENLAGMPRAKWGTIEGFFDRLAERRDDLPVWQGEMYMQGHRGVQTTQAELKRRFRAVERALQVREAAACVLGQPTDAATDHAWRRIVFAQFHDYIPGSSVPEVYEEHLPELAQLVEAVERDTADAFANGSDENAAEPGWFNPLPVPQAEWLDGRRVSLSPLSVTAESALEEAPAAPVRVTEDGGRVTLANGRAAFVLDAEGRLEAITRDGVDVALREPAGELYTFPDHPANYDAWDVDRATLANGRRVDSAVNRRIDNPDGPIPQVVYSRAVGRSSRAEVRYELRPGETVLRIQIDLDWQDPQTLLKWAAPTNYTGRMARFGAPYGSTLRPQHVGPLENDAMFEVPGSRWAAVADDTERDGLMLVTEAKYGFGCRDGLLHLSLIRSPRYTGHRGEGGGNASANVADRCSDLGPHTAHFAVGVYSADAPRAEQPAALADTLFTPPVRVTATPGDAGLRGLEGGDSLVPAWAKPVFDTEPGGWTLRLHETLGRRGAAHLKFAAGCHAQQVDLKGDPLAPLDASPSEADGLRVDFAPYQILSYRITRRGD